MQSLTSFSTASLLVKTSDEPFVNSWVRFFSKNSSLENSSLGVVGPTFQDQLVSTSELGVDWNVMFPDGVCGEVLVVFKFDYL